MILTVSGWREFTDREFVRHHLRRYLRLHGYSQMHIRVGDAKGVDEVIRFMCRSRCLSHTVYTADWDTFGRGAGAIRNGQMLHGEDPQDPFYGVPTDALLAFPQPGVDLSKRGSGTADCIRQARKMGLEPDIPEYSENWS